jgi:transcriptional regulator with XRE-family HTH domain
MARREKPEGLEGFGRLLALLRTALGMDQKDLSRVSGVKASLISDYERGESMPSTANLFRLFSAMDLRLSALDAGRDFLRNLRLHRISPPREEDPAAGLDERLASLAREAGRVMEQLRSFQALLASREHHLDAREEPEEKAPELWNEMKRHPFVRQRRLVREKPAFQSRGLCELLCERSVEQAVKNPGKARELAQLALLIASELARENETGDRGLRAYALAHLANAHRVAGDLQEARRAFDNSRRMLALVDPAEVPPSYQARILDLEASLRRSQRRLPEAVDLLDRALAIEGSARGRLLIKKSKTREEMGDLESAIALLREAEPFVNPEKEPRLWLCLRHNLLDYLSKLGRAAEAESLLPEVRTLSGRLGNELDWVRLQWAEGRIEAGLGRRERAIEILNRVRGEFAAEEIGFDTALVTLELAVLYAEDGRTAEVKVLARHLVPVFAAQDVHREALAALTLFRQAAEKEAVTVRMASRLLDYLRRAQHEPDLRFELL